MSWEPIDLTTPAHWTTIYARRFGSTGWAVVVSASPAFLVVGAQVPPNNRGLMFFLGPLLIAVVRLKSEGATDDEGM